MFVHEEFSVCSSHVRFERPWKNMEKDIIKAFLGGQVARDSEVASCLSWCCADGIWFPHSCHHWRVCRKMHQIWRGKGIPKGNRVFFVSRSLWNMLFEYGMMWYDMVWCDMDMDMDMERIRIWIWIRIRIRIWIRIRIRIRVRIWIWLWYDMICYALCYDRRKFRSDISYNMNRWKSTARKKLSHSESQTWEDQRWNRSAMEKVRSEKNRRWKRSDRTKR